MCSVWCENPEIPALFLYVRLSSVPYKLEVFNTRGSFHQAVRSCTFGSMNVYLTLYERDTFNKFKFILFAKFRKKNRTKLKRQFFGEIFLIIQSTRKVTIFWFEKNPQTNATSGTNTLRKTSKEKYGKKPGGSWYRIKITGRKPTDILFNLLWVN